jgi:hypothetical protein
MEKTRAPRAEAVAMVSSVEAVSAMTISWTAPRALSRQAGKRVAAFLTIMERARVVIEAGLSIL